MGDDTDKDHLNGTIEKIVYRSDDTGYTVAKLKTSDKASITLVGNCAAIWEGERIQADGRWIDHKQHGRQFQADAIQCTPPITQKGIRRYLASGVIKGIGPVTADALVDRFGDRTLDIIEKESGRLLDVPGIGHNKSQQIKRSWNEQKAVDSRKLENAPDS